MEMQRRHFQLIAGVLSELNDNLLELQLTSDQHIRIAEEFADALTSTNSNFN